jgi:hypothetical protein
MRRTGDRLDPDRLLDLRRSQLWLRNAVQLDRQVVVVLLAHERLVRKAT